MSMHSEQRVIACSPEQFFDIVADVESYPVFLPFWREAKVYRRTGQVYYTRQEIGIGPVRENFRSKTTLQPPTQIDIVSSEPMFQEFAIHWKFKPTPAGECQIRFTLSIEARSGLLRKIMDALLADTARSMVAAFERRAGELYGSK
ncbi:MAG: type II toxin-antitoxin system RatA family toxin [Gammaproteobacteria bacterium]